MVTLIVMKATLTTTQSRTIEESTASSGMVNDEVADPVDLLYPQGMIPEVAVARRTDLWEAVVTLPVKPQPRALVAVACTVYRLIQGRAIAIPTL